MSTQFYYNYLPSDALDTLIESDEAYSAFIDAFGKSSEEEERLKYLPSLTRDIWEDCKQGSVDRKL